MFDPEDLYRFKLQCRFYRALEKRGVPVHPRITVSEVKDLLMEHGLERLVDPSTTFGEIEAWLDLEEKDPTIH